MESGGFGTWSTVTIEGDAKLGVAWPDAITGTCAGRFQITSTATSRANLTRALPAGTTDVWADGWFRVDDEGQSNSNVGFFRYFDGSSRIADIYRQNVSSGIWIRTTDSRGSNVYTPLGIDIPLGRWTHVRFHVRAAGSASTIEAWIDGTKRYGATVWLPTSRLTNVLLGSEHQSQKMDLRFDDIVLEAG